jgi:hypothetical protein
MPAREGNMDRYSKAVLSIIAAALIGLNVQWLCRELSPSLAHATDQELMPVFVAQVAGDAANCLAGHFWFSNGDTGPCIAAW